MHFGYCVQVLVRMVDPFLFQACSLKKDTLRSFKIDHCPKPPPQSLFAFAFPSSGVHCHPQHLLHPVAIVDSMRQLVATSINSLGGTLALGQHGHVLHVLQGGPQLPHWY
jgi:hypothetical protein